jgi:hypothetical protein
MEMPLLVMIAIRRIHSLCWNLIAAADYHDDTVTDCWRTF